MSVDLVGKIGMLKPKRRMWVKNKKNNMGSIISAIGTANPSHRFQQKELLSFMINAHGLTEREALRLKKLYDASGIDYRYSVIPDFGSSGPPYSFFGNNPGLEPFPGTRERSVFYEKTAFEIGLEATGNAFKKLSWQPSDITHLITVSCTGMYAPGLDIDLIQRMELNQHIERTCINFMGCYGAFNALKTADYICRADADAKVLIVAVELCTLHFQRENTLENWVANSLFADGAAAVLIQSDASGENGLRLNAFYNCLLTDAREEMAWRIGDTGFEMRLSSRIARNIGRKIGEVAGRLMGKSQVDKQSVQHIAIHPGGRRILEVCEEMLELPEEALDYSYEVLRNHGNMSSVTILFILERMQQKINQGELLSGFAFGPGLTVESMLLEAI